MNRKKNQQVRVRGFLLCFRLHTASNPFHFLIYFGIYCFLLLSYTMYVFILACFGSSKVATRKKNSGIGVRCFSFVGSYKPVTIFLDFVWGGGHSWKESRRLMLP